jgi:uncharacterized phage-associated protein
MPLIVTRPRPGVHSLLGNGRYCIGHLPFDQRDGTWFARSQFLMGSARLLRYHRGTCWDALMFDELRAAQMAAYFIGQAGGRMSVLKLMKLMYIADRISIQKHGHPITFDHMVSMDHGPVLSSVYNLAQGTIEGHPKGWEYWISDREDHDVAVRRPVDVEFLEDLSDADIDVLAETWRLVGHLRKWEIRDWTHKNLKEWKDPHGSSIPIAYESVFTALGLSRERAEKMAENLHQQASIRRNLRDR